MRRLLICLLFWACAAAQAARLPGPTEVSVFVILEGEPLVADSPSGVRPAASFLPWPDRKQEIAAQQRSLETQLVLLGGTVTDRFDTLLNALLVRLPAAQLPAVRKLPGVRAVRAENHFTPLVSTSVPWVRAPEGWSLSTGPWTGSGIRIAIIDSGIDYNHASLGGSGDPEDFANNNPAVLEAGTFPTARVIGGTDFVGDNYDSRGVSGSPTARPDLDPLDTFANTHGTHVAAIAAGNGVRLDGTPYTGPYNDSLDFSQLSLGPGVAPEAKLYAYKVFGSAGSTSAAIIVRALERSLDPNQDGNFSDRVDVVNLSLGSPFGVMDGTDPEAEAINRLVNQGVIVVVAAGNNGNTYYTMSSPGIANRGITVANSLDDGATFSTIKVLAPAAVAGDYASAEGVFTPPLKTHGPVSAQVVQTDPPLACETLKNTAALQGKIALIDRGTCFFVDKIRRAQAAGAIGVIVVNNVDGPPIEMGGQGDTSDIDIPGVMISQLDGSILKGQLANGLTATLDAFAAVGRPELADQISDSSSRGPSIGDNRLKPDLAAPGTGIVSAKAGTGFDTTSQTGTSMSAPHVAGAAALLRQAHPTWTVEDIKTALMNTAAPMLTGSKIPYPESRIGAGRLNVEAALRTQSLVRAETSQGDVSLSFGAFEAFDPVSVTRNVRVVNHGALPITFQISARQTLTNPGVTLTPLADSITVAGRSSAQVGVRMDLDPAQLLVLPDPTSGSAIGDKIRYYLNEVSGQLWFTNATQQLHLPWHLTARPNSAYSVAATNVGVPAGSTVTVPFPTRGTTHHPEPLASIFELGYLDLNGGNTAGDLLAAGVTSDYSRTRNLEQTRIYFGLATGGKWVTPQYELVGLEVEVDTNLDNTADFLLLNASSGNLNGQGIDPDLANDALLTLVADMILDDDYFVASSPLNLLPPTVRDTAPFHNRVVLHSVDASVLGLTAAQPRIKYRLTTTDSLSGGQTESPWIEFNVTAPLVDPTPYGLSGSPLFDEGSSPRAEINRTAATAAGFNASRPLRALVLHQHGRAGQQINVVTLNLATADTDGDSLPDAWELENLGDLASTATSDPDGDGQNNAVELAAGTNPLDVRMLLPDVTTGALRWQGFAGRQYTLERAASLNGPFEPIARRLNGVNGLNSLVDPSLTTGNQSWFYRIRPE